MSSFVSTEMAPPVEATRRRLSARQAATVDKLVEAVAAEVHDTSFDQVTVRSVAARAGVSAATAYTYFASKEHLVSEVYWRRLRELPETPLDGRLSTATRVSRTLADIATLVADQPELAAAVSSAMLAGDPDVKLLRDRIGAETHRRIVAALGPAADRAVVRTLDLAVAGAMLNVGMGHLSYDELPERLAEVAVTVLKGTS